MAFYPNLNKLVPTRLFQSLSAKYQSHNKMTEEKCLKRKESKLDRADFISNLVKPENNVSDIELFGNSSILIIAGSETTATMLSATIFFLCKYPEVMAKLIAEVRSRFQSQSEITFQNVNKLQYLLACVNESLRLFPPSPNGLPRKVPQGGDFIDGKWVAAGVSLPSADLALHTNTYRPTSVSSNGHQI